RTRRKWHGIPATIPPWLATKPLAATAAKGLSGCRRAPNSQLRWQCRPLPCAAGGSKGCLTPELETEWERRPTLRAPRGCGPNAIGATQPDPAPPRRKHIAGAVAAQTATSGALPAVGRGARALAPPSPNGSEPPCAHPSRRVVARREFDRRFP